jgi:hypothetical protein
VNPRKLLTSLALCILATVPGGCFEKHELPPVDHYVNADALRQVQRITLVEFLGPEADARVSSELTGAVAQAIGGRGAFAVQVVGVNEELAALLPADARQAMTLSQFNALRRSLQSDYAMIGSIENFRAYPQMRLTVHMRLFDLRQGRLVWGLDHSWDTTEKATEARMKQYFQKHIREGYEPYDYKLAEVSPQAFEKFVAYEIARALTIPEVPAVENPKNNPSTTRSAPKRPTSQ